MLHWLGFLFRSGSLSPTSTGHHSGGDGHGGGGSRSRRRDAPGWPGAPVLCWGLPLLATAAGAFVVLVWVGESPRYAWPWAPPAPWPGGLSASPSVPREVCAAAITSSVFGVCQAVLLGLLVLLTLRLGCRALGRLGARGPRLRSPGTASVAEMAMVVGPCMGTLSTCYGIVAASLAAGVDKQEAVLLIFPPTGLGVLILMLATALAAACGEE